jgi:guanyl-specific ribonuclease Sa
MKRQILLLFLIMISVLNEACRDRSQTKTATETQETTSSRAVSDENDATKPHKKGQKERGMGNSDSDRTPPNAAADKHIPAKVFKVWTYVRTYDEPMLNYVGGRTFQNRERRLESKDAQGKRIQYKEWDVNPKRHGQNRGVERLVTGSDGRAWYTNDHYQTFVEVK